jgi:elongation factor 1-beta
MCATAYGETIDANCYVVSPQCVLCLRCNKYPTMSRPADVLEGKKEETKPAAPAAAVEAALEEEFDVFGEETDEEQQARMATKLAYMEAKKKEKAAVSTKSRILLDVKTWDATIDLQALALKIESNVRDGLTWRAHIQTLVAFGMKKLQLLLVIEDNKVSLDDIEELIMKYEDEVQSMDVVAWNKV